MLAGYAVTVQRAKAVPVTLALGSQLAACIAPVVRACYAPLSTAACNSAAWDSRAQPGKHLGNRRASQVAVSHWSLSSCRRAAVQKLQESLSTGVKAALTVPQLTEQQALRDYGNWTQALELRQTALKAPHQASV